MTLRFVPNTYTLDEQRQEINNLASDVNAIDTTFDERVDDRLSALLSGGTGISAVYNDNSNSLSLSIDFTEFDTDSLTEGTSKLFFTQSRARQSFSIAAEPAASGNGALAYDNTTGIFTYTPPALTLADITANGNTTTTDITVGGLSVNTNNLNAANNIYITTANKEFGFYEGGKIAVVDTATPGLGALTLVHRDVNGEETLAKFTRDSGAELYYDGSKKLETTLTGVTVTGGVSSSTLRIGSGPGNTATVEIDGTIRSSTHTFTVGSIIQFSTAGGTADVTLIDNDSITTGSLTAQSGVDVATGQAYKINNVNVLTATALGSGVTSSSLTSVGTLTSLTVSGDSTFTNNLEVIHSSGSNPGIRLEDTSSNTLIGMYYDTSSTQSYLISTQKNLNIKVYTPQDVYISAGDETMAFFESNGTVQLYYDNSKKFETLVDGVSITGNTDTDSLTVTGAATFSGTNVKINAGTSLDFGNDSGDLHIYKQSGGGSDSIIKYDGAYNFKVLSDITTLASSTGSITWGVFGNNGVELYYSNSKKFETTSSGITVNGTNINLSTANTPASATATGTTGDIRWDAEYIYVCVATDTWKRSPISTWP